MMQFSHEELKARVKCHPREDRGLSRKDGGMGVYHEESKN
jgi:hypothetical protein